MKASPILIISGEPYSVFFEIFTKTINSRFIKKIKNPIILIGSKNLLHKQIKKLNYKNKIEVIDKNKINKINKNHKIIKIINVDFNFKKTFDKITSSSSKYIEECFDIATSLLKKNNNLKLISGPISKKHFLKKKYPGITEYLSKKTNSQNKEVMLIYNDSLSVSPITTHISLKKVSKTISTKKIVQNVITINNFYKKFLKKKIKFAVTGLNPHCESREGNNEEKNIIIPAINLLRKKKIKIDGPFSADTIFIKQNVKNYDVIIGMYHDQVLGPIKTLYEFDAINITLGLPFLRISPDHGPNNSMLGKNISNTKSLEKSLHFLDKI